MYATTSTTAKSDPCSSEGTGPVGKKRYQTPKLVDYGGIRALTANMGTQGALDGVLFFKTAVSQ